MRDPFAVRTRSDVVAELVDALGPSRLGEERWRRFHVVLGTDGFKETDAEREAREVYEEAQRAAEDRAELQPRDERPLGERAPVPRPDHRTGVERSAGGDV